MRRVAVVLVAAGLLMSACGAASEPADDQVTSTSTSASTSTEPAEEDSTPEEEAAEPMSDEEGTPTTEGDEEGTPTTEGTEPEEADSATTPESIPESDEGSASTGEVPEDMLASIFQDAGVDPASATVSRAESVTWADGGLGCPEPGENYTLAPVDGYWVQFEAGGEEYDYRAIVSGFFRRCTSPVPSGPTS